MTDGDFLPGDKRPNGPVPPEPPGVFRADMHDMIQDQTHCLLCDEPSSVVLCGKCRLAHQKKKALASDSNWVKCADGIERPSHYANYPIDPVTFAMINDLPAWKFQVVKYTCRAGLKGDEEDDIRKAMRHLEMRLELLKRQKEDTLGHVVGRPL